MKRRGNPPTLQTVQRLDTGLPYHTLDTRRLRNASPLQTKLGQRRHGRKLFWIIVGVGILLVLAVALARPAHGAAVEQVVCVKGYTQAICPPWQMAEPPQMAHHWVALPILNQEP